MTILLTNDDGIESKGLQVMCKALTDAGYRVLVVAPDSQRSACSHSISFHKEHIFTKYEQFFGAAKCYSSTGTPADCVKFGVDMLNEKIDLLISGPNDGENYGNDALYSATIGAAEEGVVCSIKSIAVSREHFGDENFESCSIFVLNNLEKLISACGNGVFLNINVPNLPYNEIKGAVVVKQGNNKYHDYYISGKNPNGYVLTGEKIAYSLDNYDDVSMLEQGYVTVTPMKLNQTDETLLAELRGTFSL